MTDDKRLHDALIDLVPTPPPAPDRASGARSYARRARRGRITAGLAATAVAVAVVVPLALTRGSGDHIEPRPVATCTPPTVVAGDFAFPVSPGPL